jgi:hypothetical protein
MPEAGLPRFLVAGAIPSRVGPAPCFNEEWPDGIASRFRHSVRKN